VSLANLYGAGVLALHGDFFAHGPDRPIQELIRSLGTDKVAVIHDPATAATYNTYVCLRYAFGSTIPQYTYHDGGSGSIRIVDYPKRRAMVDPMALSPEYLILIHGAIQETPEIIDQLRHGIRPIAAGPVARRLVASGRWVPVKELMITAYMAARVTLIQRASAADRNLPRVERDGKD
jgi:hypothetical protein